MTKYKYHRTEGDNPFQCVKCNDYFYHAQSKYSLCDNCYTTDNIAIIDKQETEEDKEIEKEYEEWKLSRENEYWINTLNSKCNEIIKGDKLYGHKNLEDKNKTWNEILNLSNEDKIELIRVVKSKVINL